MSKKAKTTPAAKGTTTLFNRYIPDWEFSSTSMHATQTPLSRVGGPKSSLPSIPTLYYTEEAWLKIDYIVEKSPKEVGWFGTVEKLDDVSYLVKDIYVPEQTVSSVETDIEESAMADLAIEIMNAGGDPSELRYWGHSHVNMGVSPSVQDENQVDEYLNHVDYFIRGIHNKRGDAKVDFYDTENGIVFQCIDNEVLGSELTKEAQRELDKILKEKVTNQVYHYQNYNKNNFGQSSSNVSNLPSTRGSFRGHLDEGYDDDLDAAYYATRHGEDSTEQTGLNSDIPTGAMDSTLAEIMDLYEEGMSKNEILAIYPGFKNDIEALFDPFHVSK